MERSTSAWFATEGSCRSCTTSPSTTTMGRIGDPELRPYGNGVALLFEIDDFDAAVRRAEALNTGIAVAPHRNPPEGLRRIARSGCVIRMATWSCSQVPTASRRGPIRVLRDGRECRA